MLSSLFESFFCRIPVFVELSSLLCWSPVEAFFMPEDVSTFMEVCLLKFMMPVRPLAGAAFGVLVLDLPMMLCKPADSRLGETFYN